MSNESPNGKPGGTAKPVDPNKPDPNLIAGCKRYGHSFDENGKCRDCGLQT